MSMNKDFIPVKLADVVKIYQKPFDDMYKRQMRLIFISFAILIIVFASLILVLLSN